MQMLYNVHLTSEKVDNTAMMADQTRVILAACDCLGLDISRLKLALNVSWHVSLFAKALINSSYVKLCKIFNLK